MTALWSSPRFESNASMSLQVFYTTLAILIASDLLGFRLDCAPFITKRQWVSTEKSEATAETQSMKTSCQQFLSPKGARYCYGEYFSES